MCKYSKRVSNRISPGDRVSQRMRLEVGIDGEIGIHDIKAGAADAPLERGYASIQIHVFAW